MKTRILILTTLITVLGFTSCKKGSFYCVNGNGSTTTETRYLQSASNISIDIPVDVYVTQDTSESDMIVEIRTSENLLEYIKTDVDGNSLKIHTEKCISSYNNTEIHIRLPQIHSLLLNGSGNVFGENRITTNELILEINGSGDMEMGITSSHIQSSIRGSGNMKLEVLSSNMTNEIIGSGNMYLRGINDVNNLTISGSGDIYGFGLENLYTDIKISGSGDARIKSLNDLHVNIAGSGDVYYKGNPNINVHITGSGNVINAN